MNKSQLIAQIKSLSEEMKITFIEACQAMQAAAAQLKNEKMIAEIHVIKMESLGL